MVIDMNDEQLRTLADLQDFLNGTVAMDFTVAADEQYEFIARTVRRFGYGRLKRPDKAVVLRFLERVSGYSRQQITRLVKRGCERRQLIKRYHGSRTSFARTYTGADVLLLAHTDTLHGTLSGLATRKLMERAYGIFGDARYQRLATISVAHLYNLRQRPSYQHQRQVWTKTRPATVPIGERRAPTPNNRPGYLRVDSVHQGDLDGMKGVYHINAVDCVTQYEGVATCERISEAFLIPVLEALLQSFPFDILGFHSDNGSEYINRNVAQLLNKLLIEEQTKSRSRHSNEREACPWGTMHRLSRRTDLSYASILATPRRKSPWGTAISRSALQRPSIRSVAITSTRTSTSIAHACSLKSLPTPRADSANVIPTN
jgi:hypothetical protein